MWEWLKQNNLVDGFIKDLPFEHITVPEYRVVKTSSVTLAITQEDIYEIKKLYSEWNSLEKNCEFRIREEIASRIAKIAVKPNNIKKYAFNVFQ